jgi:hypothetical protein
MQFSLLLLFVVVVIAVVVSRSAHRQALFGNPTATTGAAPGRGARDRLHETLVRWRDEGLIETTQVDAIERYEAEHRPPAPRVPLAAEAIGYVGSALVVTALALVVGRRWDDLPTVGRLAVLLVPAMLTAALGWWSGRSDEGALRRLGSVLWVLSCAALVGSLVELWVDIVHDGDPPRHGGVLFVAALATTWAALLWWRRPLLLQHVALFAGLVATAMGVVDWWWGHGPDDASSVPWGSALVAVGLGWMLFTQAVRRPLDEFGAMLGAVLGAGAMLFGAQIVAASERGAAIWLGVGIAAALVAIGVVTSRLDLLLPGAFGVFQWSPQLALHYLSDSLGTEATLLVVGVLLIVLAAGFTRLSRRLLGRARTRA